MKGRRLTGSKKSMLGTCQRGSPLFNWGATPLATCWGEGGLPAFFLSLLPAAEPEAD